MVLNSVNVGKLTDFHLPEPIVGPQAWYGPDLRIANDWIYHFSKEDIAADTGMQIRIYHGPVKASG